ncbi:hypothetical protein JNJ66_07495 [Candidatus Saccharibacteria bacterium]|nr:hypothetical protein [Candidatus Saccharibacteria bacterium]
MTLPSGMESVLARIVEGLLAGRFDPMGDYGTAPFDMMLQGNNTPGGQRVLRWLDRSVTLQTEGGWRVIFAHPERLADPIASGLTLALVPAGADDCSAEARYFGIWAAERGGVRFIERADDAEVVAPETSG